MLASLTCINLLTYRRSQYVRWFNEFFNPLLHSDTLRSAGNLIVPFTLAGTIVAHKVSTLTILSIMRLM
jgi:hypothetical protein